jgi:23S rRNA pseudouridine1911/1915/1917 synthase
MPRPRFQPGSAHTFTLKRGVGERSVAAYLATRLSVPETWARALLKRDRVCINDEAVAADARFDFVRGTTVRIAFPDEWMPYLRPTPMPLDILYEDAAIIVLNKPPGLAVHPARGHMDGRTLFNGVRYRYLRDLQRPDTTVAPPHRLDLNTSGVIVFSRTRAAYQDLVRQFSEQVPHKEYLAVVQGRPNVDYVVCESPLGVDPNNPSRGAVVPVEQGGKASCTELTVVEQGQNWALIRACPRTGRPHQVRLHLAHLGWPVIGDPDYNPDPSRHRPERQALHAVGLSIRHPVSNKRLSFEAQIPEDIRQLLGRLRGTQDVHRPAETGNPLEAAPDAG